jgi:predicted AAA+ superfamily ATPase
VLELAGFSLGEALERPGQGWFASWLQRAAADPEAAATDLTAGFSAGVSPVQVVWRGSFPEVQTLGAEVVPGWMRGYVSTYLQRDVRSLLAVRDEMQFGAFLALCSALTAQECNCSQMGRDIGLSTPTAQSWLSVLRGTFQWLEVPAFATNQVKKLSQKAKGYVTDTGLACYLARLSSPEALLGHPAFGALFETYVVLDLLKQVQGLPLPPTFHHYRQHSGAEVDLVAELDGRLYPVEIKAASTVKPRDTQSLAGFREKLGSRAGPGLVVYAGREVYRVGDGCLAVPFDLMLT